MRLILFILLLCSNISYGQGDKDSIAHIRKPVLRWYIQQAYHAKALHQDSIRQSGIVLDLRQQVKTITSTFETELSAEKEKTRIAEMVGLSWQREMVEIKAVLQADIRRQKIWKWVGFGFAGVATAGLVKVAVSK